MLPIQSQEQDGSHTGEIHSSLDLFPLSPIYCKRNKGGIIILLLKHSPGPWMCKHCVMSSTCISLNLHRGRLMRRYLNGLFTYKKKLPLTFADTKCKEGRKENNTSLSDDLCPVISLLMTTGPLNHSAGNRSYKSSPPRVNSHFMTCRTAAYKINCSFQQFSSGGQTKHWRDGAGESKQIGHRLKGRVHPKIKNIFPLT